MTRLGVLASGSGTNLQAIIDACRDGMLAARVTVVISNNSQCGAMKRARSAGIPAIHLSGKTHPDAEALDRALSDALAEHDVDLVIMAGYMKRLGEHTLNDWQGRIVNIHPSLLPRHGGAGMYGPNVHRAVIEAGDEVTGITIHYVEGDYDTGPTIAQTEIPVAPDDDAESLARRVLEEEHAFLVATLRTLVSGSRG
ncbi:MAG: phosphoribosylglycinamide formyltransferase [Gammaproteobacteria bacterium]|nr:phosphoribosylglycinamide formyltransferase [Gammaproteobacteria bacterium]